MRVVLLGCLLLTAPAALARTAIEGPARIDKPGSYVVTRNIRSVGEPALVITASHVVLDLGGHAVRTEAPSCCVIFVSPGVGVRIENGSISGEGGGVGIAGQGSAELSIENLTFDRLDVGVRLTDSRAAALRHNRVTREVSVGFDVPVGESFVIEDNTLESATGVNLNAVSCAVRRNAFGGELPNAPLVLGPQATGNLVTDNVIRSIGEGIAVQGSGNHIERNVIHTQKCSLWFKPQAARNLYRANTSRTQEQSCSCPVAARGSVCDEGEGNTSSGDNYLPDPM